MKLVILSAIFISYFVWPSRGQTVGLLFIFALLWRAFLFLSVRSYNDTLAVPSRLGRTSVFSADKSAGTLACTPGPSSSKTMVLERCRHDLRPWGQKARAFAQLWLLEGPSLLLDTLILIRMRLSSRQSRTVLECAWRSFALMGMQHATSPCRHCRGCHVPSTRSS